MSEQLLLERINELEVKLSFQEDLLSTLNNQVILQDREIRNLWIANNILKQSMDDAKSSSDNIADEPPPHY